MRSPRAPACLVLALLLPFAGCVGSSDGSEVRLGFFANLTHAAALYGIQEGLFADALPPGVELTTTALNAGPSAFESLLAQRLDIIYVGPSPTANAFLVTGGDVVRIVAGASSGGAAFVVQPELADASDAGFADRRFASPQLGNTQDVSLKHYLKARGHSSRAVGGDVDIINAPNPDIMVLFQQRDIDGAWVPEPWASRLVAETGGKVLVDERDLWPGGAFVTTHLVTTKAFLDRHPTLVRAVVAAHVDAVGRLTANDSAAWDPVNAQIEAETGKRLPAELLAAAAKNVNITVDPLSESFLVQFSHAKDLGLATGSLPPLGRMYDLRLLNDVLRERGLGPVTL